MTRTFCQKSTTSQDGWAERTCRLLRSTAGRSALVEPVAGRRIDDDDLRGRYCHTRAWQTHTVTPFQRAARRPHGTPRACRQGQFLDLAQHACTRWPEKIDAGQALFGDRPPGLYVEMLAERLHLGGGISLPAQRARRRTIAIGRDV